MPYNYGLHLLEIELQQELKKRDVNEKWFAEKGVRAALNDYCTAIDRIEQLEQAIKILKQGLRGPQSSY